jgi:hypothetical protein
MILQNVLTQFLSLGVGDTGSRAVGGGQIDVFNRALKSVADVVRGVLNKDGIRQLVDFNYDVADYPELRVRRLSEGADHRALAVALRNFVEPGVITPTPELEEFVSEIVDLPRPTKEALDRGYEDRLFRETLRVQEATPPGWMPGEEITPAEEAALNQPMPTAKPGPPPKPTNANGSRKGSRTGRPVE